MFDRLSRSSGFAFAVAFAAFASFSSVARAQEEDSTPAPAATPASAATPAAGEDADDGAAPLAKAKKDKAPRDKTAKESTEKIVFSARVFALDSYASETDASTGAPGEWANRISVASARFGATFYRDDVKAKIDAELDGTPRLRDAYIRLKASHELAVRAGLFKVPASGFELEELWDLPVVERGMLSDIVTGRYQIAGRHAGANIEYDGPGEFHPTLRAGVWQGFDNAGRPIDGTRSGNYATDQVVRGEAGTHGLTIGASFESRSGQATAGAPPGRYGSGEVDAHYDAHGLRVWVEAMTGTSWIDAAPGDRKAARFSSGRFLAAWRWRGEKDGALYVEPFAMISGLDPDHRLQDDLDWEAVGGANVGRWNRWKLQLEFSRQRVGRNSPVGIGPLGLRLPERSAVLLQLAANFE